MGKGNNKKRKSKTRKSEGGIRVSDLVEVLAKSFVGVATDEDYARVGEFYLTQDDQIYRYLPATYDAQGYNRDIQSLYDSKIWFSAPQHFNDPFDCNMEFDFEQAAERILQYHPDLKEARAQLSELPYIDKLSIKKELMDEALQDSKNEYQSIIQESNKIGVSCMSSRRDSILMWGHYANNHRGICVQYSLQKLQKECQYFFLPILYDSQRAAPTFEDDLNIARFLFKRLFSKSTDWEYEKEWRCIQDSESCGSAWTQDGALLDAPKPDAIYIGCAADEKLRNDVISLCENLKIEAFQMSQDRKAFKLNEEKIN